jgi:hypothetical protein
MECVEKETDRATERLQELSYGGYVDQVNGAEGRGWPSSADDIRFSSTLDVRIVDNG